MKALGEDGRALASFDPLILDSKFFSRFFSQILYSHVRSDANKLVHGLVRYSFNITNYAVWMEDVSPQFYSVF